MTETGGNNAYNDEPAKQANGLDIILSLACAGSFVITIICYLIFKLMQYDAVALITCTIGFISFAVMLITGLILMIPALKTRTRIIMIILMPNAYAGIMDLTFLNTLRAMKTKFA